jgi:hypothetical protein
MITSSAKPLPVSLVIVSDYEAGGKTWADERSAIAAFTADPEGVPSQIVIVESVDAGRFPRIWLPSRLSCRCTSQPSSARQH